MFIHRIDERSELRLPDPAYAEELTEVVLRNLARLAAWMPWAVESYSVEDARAFITRNRRQFADREGFAALIFHENRLAGVAGLNTINWPNRKAEIGYWLDAPHEGRGLVTRSCRALVNHCFGELGLNRVEMYVGVGNARSRRVPERLGFTEEGVLRQGEWLHGRPIDLVLYAMLAGEWKEKGAPRHTT